MSVEAFQSIGDRLTLALLSGDFALYRSLIALPMTITPRNGETYILHDEAALREDFDLYHNMLAVSGVTDVFRDVLDVDQSVADKAIVRVMTHIMVNALRVSDPFETRFFLVGAGGHWAIREIESSAEHIDWTLGKASPAFGWV